MVGRLRATCTPMSIERSSWLQGQTGIKPRRTSFRLRIVPQSSTAETGAPFASFRIPSGRRIHRVQPCCLLRKPLTHPFRQASFVKDGSFPSRPRRARRSKPSCRRAVSSRQVVAGCSPCSLRRFSRELERRSVTQKVVRARPIGPIAAGSEHEKSKVLCLRPDRHESPTMIEPCASRSGSKLAGPSG